MRRRGSDRLRGGSALAALLMLSVMVTVIGLSAAGLARAGMKQQLNQADSAEAKMAAESGVQLALVLLTKDTTWRSRPAGYSITRTFGRTEVTITVVDPVDGDLSDSLTDPVCVATTASLGATRPIVSTWMEPVLIPLPSLSTSLYAGDELKLKENVSVTGGAIATSGKATIDKTLTGDLLAGSRAGQGSVTGTSTVPCDPFAEPEAGVFALWAARATRISCSSNENKFVLSAGVNPWGSLNADGIYLITPSSDLELKDCRVSGTLLIDCPGKKVTLKDSVHFACDVAERPTLIVRGNLHIDLKNDRATLSESSASVNFNPAGAPYQGITDSDTADAYPNGLTGLIHVIGDITIKEGGRVNGVVLCEGTVTVENTSSFTCDTSISEHPPEGYLTTSGAFEVVPGKWRRGREATVVSAGAGGGQILPP